MCLKATYELFKLENIRRVLAYEAVETIAVGIAMSHPDYLHAV